ncbi:hypothetical protein R1flu_009127 [Riccia fluitans]|uniref:Uncharacterized protein n=1 Tax=Riccia fluitans TaxID=41844 RepID=A0ABD1Z213_9MARC
MNAEEIGERFERAFQMTVFRALSRSGSFFPPDLPVPSLSDIGEQVLGMCTGTNQPRVEQVPGMGTTGANQQQPRVEQVPGMGTGADQQQPRIEKMLGELLQRMNEICDVQVKIEGRVEAIGARQRNRLLCPQSPDHALQPFPALDGQIPANFPCSVRVVDLLSDAQLNELLRAYGLPETTGSLWDKKIRLLRHFGLSTAVAQTLLPFMPSYWGYIGQQVLGMCTGANQPRVTGANQLQPRVEQVPEMGTGADQQQPRIEKMLGELLQRMNEICDVQVKIEGRLEAIEARQRNSLLCPESPDHALQPFPALDGMIPANFPRSVRVVDLLSDAQLNELLRAYGPPETTCSLWDKKIRLLRHFGISTAVAKTLLPFRFSYGAYAPPRGYR